MKLRQKWLKASGVEIPISHVARRAVVQRVHTLKHYYPLAVERCQEDVEYVHQLRVACRRGVAALDVFAPLLGPRKSSRARKWLGRIRRSAGDARELDVLQAQLREDATLSGADRDDYLAALKPLRKLAQRQLRAGFQRAKRKRWARKLKLVTRSARWRGDGQEPTFEQFARTAFGASFEPFIASAVGDLSDFAQLHRLRIEGKKVRYAIELLAAGLPETFRAELYPPVEQLQEKLGRINDYASAGERCRRWLRQVADADAKWEQLAADQSALADQAADEFRQWWTQERIEALQKSWHATVS